MRNAVVAQPIQRIDGSAWSLLWWFSLIFLGISFGVLAPSTSIAGVEFLLALTLFMIFAVFVLSKVTDRNLIAVSIFPLIFLIFYCLGLVVALLSPALMILLLFLFVVLMIIHVFVPISFQHRFTDGFWHNYFFPVLIKRPLSALTPSELYDVTVVISGYLALFRLLPFILLPILGLDVLVFGLSGHAATVFVQQLFGILGSLFPLLLFLFTWQLFAAQVYLDDLARNAVTKYRLIIGSNLSSEQLVELSKVINILRDQLISKVYVPNFAVSSEDMLSLASNSITSFSETLYGLGYLSLVSPDSASKKKLINLAITSLEPLMSKSSITVRDLVRANAKIKSNKDYVKFTKSIYDLKIPPLPASPMVKVRRWADSKYAWIQNNARTIVLVAVTIAYLYLQSEKEGGLTIENIIRAIKDLV